MSYQSLKSYNGSMYGTPLYRGLEYDWEVPDNMVVSSPGGASTTHHHYTKGFYGEGSSQNDLYAGQGYRYPAAEHANVYQYGQNAPTQNGSLPPPPDPMYTQNNSTPTIREAFSDVEFIPPPDGVQSTVASAVASVLPKSIRVKFNWWAILGLFIIAYLAMDFYASASKGFLAAKFNNGKDLTWKQLTFYAAILTVVLVLLAYNTDSSLIGIEPS